MTTTKISQLALAERLLTEDFSLDQKVAYAIFELFQSYSSHLFTNGGYTLSDITQIRCFDNNKDYPSVLKLCEFEIGNGELKEPTRIIFSKSRDKITDYFYIVIQNNNRAVAFENNYTQGIFSNSIVFDLDSQLRFIKSRHILSIKGKRSLETYHYQVEYKNKKLKGQINLVINRIGVLKINVSLSSKEEVEKFYYFAQIYSRAFNNTEFKDLLGDRDIDNIQLIKPENGKLLLAEFFKKDLEYLRQQKHLVDMMIV